MKSKNQDICRTCTSKLTNKNWLMLCNKCKKNPFRIERLRSILAEEGNDDFLLKTYQANYPEIPNTNTDMFWDFKFAKQSKLSDQDSMTKEKIKKIANLLPKKERVTILDVGIGKAYLEQYLTDKNHNNVGFYGIDISQTAINDVNSQFKGRFFVLDALKIREKFNKSKFDCIIALELLEHISPSNILNLLNQIHSLLKPGGFFLLSVPTNEHLENNSQNPSAHVRDYTANIIAGELRLAGFVVKKQYFFYAFKDFYFIKNFLRTLIPNKWEANNIVIMAEKPK